MSPSRLPGICLQLIAFSLCALLSGGCVAYHPQPLNRAAVERALEPPPIKVLRVAAEQICHPMLRPVAFDVREGSEIGEGIGPDQAAVLAVLLNPSLRADRTRRGLACAQLIQAGLLPNPQVGYTTDFVTGGNTAGTVTAYGFTASWEITSLITHAAKVSAAKANARSVDLDIAWTEWQTAQAARTGVYKVAALEAELERSREIERGMDANLKTLQKAASEHQKTILDLAAVEASSQDARATTLQLEQSLDKERLALKRLLGLPPNARLSLARGIGLPSRLDIPSESELVAGLEKRRLDLCALKIGYESQEAKVREAILAQFPKIGLEFHQASDTTNVHTTGFGINIDLPIFDRNQGGIATETATRQKLFDEYTNRVFEARNDIATGLADARSLARQIAASEEALPVLERLVATVRTALDAHNADTLSYYTALNNLNTKRLQSVKLREQLAETRSALEIASGWCLPWNESKKQAPRKLDLKP
jgi:outer membrane protein TolC